MSAGQAFTRVLEIMHRLRAPGGCPWDREQTFESIRQYTLEETYEVLEAIGERDFAALKDELGDLLLQVVFYAEMAQEAGHFDITAVLDGLADKLVRRHPHVFEDSSGRRMNADEALGRWDAVKAAEKAAAGRTAPKSLLGSAPRGLPALAEAAKLGTRAASANFDWPDTEGVWTKLDEEMRELRSAPSPTDAEEELGDLLFTVVNLARRLGVEPETALKRANTKFRRRFESMEAECRASGESFESRSPAQMDTLWELAKMERAKTVKP